MIAAPLLFGRFTAHPKRAVLFRPARASAWSPPGSQWATRSSEIAPNAGCASYFVSIRLRSPARLICSSSRDPRSIGLSMSNWTGDSSTPVASCFPPQLSMSDRLHAFLRSVSRLPARGLLASIWVYQRTLSPVLPAVFGPACGCRFHPTCSHYAAQAVTSHGALIGAWLAVRRLLKCTPLHPGGFDPVPAPRAAARRRACLRVPASQPFSPSH